MSNLQAFYTKILSLLNELEPMDNFLNQTRIPKASDKVLIALTLAAESVGIDSERYLFIQLPDPLIGRIERSAYNRSRRQLAVKIEQLRQQIVKQPSPVSKCYLIDSMALETCKINRAKRSRICQETEQTSPDYGYCTAHNMPYFGYKIHAVCTQQGVFKTFDNSKSCVHDIHYLKDVKNQLNHCILIGGKDYLSRQYQHDFDTAAIELTTPKRINQWDFEPFNPFYRKTRKRIETLFSQLCDQFIPSSGTEVIRRNYAKSFTGLATRILSKITALTMIQWINLPNHNHINNLKIALV